MHILVRYMSCSRGKQSSRTNYLEGLLFSTVDTYIEFFFFEQNKIMSVIRNEIKDGLRKMCLQLKISSCPSLLPVLLKVRFSGNLIVFCMVLAVPGIYICHGAVAWRGKVTRGKFDLHHF